MKTALWIPLLALAVAGCIHGRSPAPDAAPSANRTLVQFGCAEGLAGWHVENDDVMGGRSQSRLSLDDAGNAVFAGTISLENDGGFASIQCDYPALDVSAYRTIRLGLKGDGQRYQLRLDAAPGDRHSYAADFQTSGDWQEIVLPFADFAAAGPAPSRYPGRTLARVQIGAPAAPFRLEIDRIWLEK